MFMNDDNVRNIREMQPIGRMDRWLLGSVCFTIVSVIVINFITSYGHIYAEGMGVGEQGVDARLMPIGIDGVLLALALANVFVTRMGRSHWLLRLALAGGVGGTVAANAAYGAHWGMTGGLIATWSPVALFTVVEAGLFMFRVAVETAAKATAPKRGRPAGSTNSRGPRVSRQDTYQGGREVAIPQIMGSIDPLLPFEHLSNAS